MYIRKKAMIRSKDHELTQLRARALISSMMTKPQQTTRDEHQQSILNGSAGEKSTKTGLQHGLVRVTGTSSSANAMPQLPNRPSLLSALMIQTQGARSKSQTQGLSTWLRKSSHGLSSNPSPEACSSKSHTTLFFSTQMICNRS